MVLAVSSVDLIFIVYSREIVGEELINITIFNDSTINRTINDTIIVYEYDCTTNVYLDVYSDIQNLAMRDIIPFVFIFILNLQTMSQLYKSQVRSGDTTTRRGKKESSFKLN